MVVVVGIGQVVKEKTLRQRCLLDPFSCVFPASFVFIPGTTVGES